MKPPSVKVDDAKPARGGAAPPPACDTPSTNRGVGISPPQLITPHWLAVTIHDTLSNVAAAYMDCFMDLPDMPWEQLDGRWFQKLEHGARGYAGAWQGLDGVRIYAYPSTGTHCHVVMSGNVLEQYVPDRFSEIILRFVDEDDFEEYIAGGQRPKLTVTRFDVAIDNCPFTPRQVFDSLDSGNFRSKARPGPWYPDTGTGSTAYIGSKKSDKQMRVYDRRGPTRLELQFRRTAAFALCYGLCGLKRIEWHDYVLGVVRGFIDFVDRRSNVSKSPLTPWWGDFVGSTSQVKLPTWHTEPDSISKLRGYADRVAPSLKALLYFDRCSADAFFERVHLRDKQLRLLASVGRSTPEHRVEHEDDVA